MLRLFARVLEHSQLLGGLDSVHAEGASAVLRFSIHELFRVLLNQERSRLLMGIFSEFATPN